MQAAPTPLSDLTVGDLATRRPASIGVLIDHGIDFCCGGGRSLEAACKRSGVSVDEVLEQVDRAERTG